MIEQLLKHFEDNKRFNEAHALKLRGQDYLKSLLNACKKVPSKKKKTKCS